jgi:hypothetical protein
MQTIDIDKVDTDDKRFCISYPLGDDLLFSSVTQSGILMPVALLNEEQPVVVTGFKRLTAAKELGMRRVPCVFLDFDEKRALLAAIMDNLRRPLNTVEKINCVERMNALAFPVPEIFGMAKLIGLPVRQRTLETASAIRTMDEKTKTFIVRHGLPITAIEQLLWFDGKDREGLLQILIPLDVTVSSFREIMQLAMILTVRSGKIDLDRLSGAGSMAELKRILKQMSHPLLTEMEGGLARLLKSCSLPPSIGLKIDPFFERDWIDISVRTHSTAETGYALKKLQDLLDEGTFGRLFELTHGLSNRN